MLSTQRRTEMVGGNSLPDVLSSTGRTKVQGKVILGYTVYTATKLQRFLHALHEAMSGIANN